ncbi:MAG: periplasmic binding protein [Rhodospirillales bacterium]|jgi:iron complex transport system substrate-binding protein|nr:periplasmic binding protein [Rhodospirillales bacterium]
MRLRPLAAALVAAALLPFAVSAQTVFTDDGGRSVTIPLHVAHVLPAGPPASADMLMMAPEKLVGTTRGLSPAEAAFLPPAAGSLPALGRLTGRGNTINLETVVKAAPDLVLDLGYVSDTFVSLADRVQQQTGIPYVLIGGGLADTPSTLRKLGTVLGTPGRAEALARYAEETLALLKDRIAAVPPDKRPSIYVARGPRGLETGIAGSINAEAIELAGGRNVATPTLGARGLATVSMEQILAWQPDVVITIDAGFYQTVWSDPLWQQLAAVKAKQIYLAPTQPFGWVDEPPAANRLIGLRWLAKLLYPSLFPEDIRSEARRFYALFYQREPSDQQLKALLAGTTPPS